MNENRNSELILCKGIKLDKNYENVLSYTKENLVNLCRNNSIYIARDYSIIPREKNKVVVNASYGSCLFANYMAFINPDYDNDWCFAWIEDVNYINDNTTEITFTVDVWSTWYERFNIGKAFIEREHVSDDSIGKHTIPEQIETGDYIINGEVTKLGLGNAMFIIATTERIDQFIFNTGYTFDLDNFGSNGNNYNGLVYYGCYNPKAVSRFINAIKNHTQLTLDYIDSIFVIPRNLLQLYNYSQAYIPDTLLSEEYKQYGDTTSTYLVLNGIKDVTDRQLEISITRPSNLNGYTPKNNKLWCYPYSTLVVTNNNGASNKYCYEYFSNNSILKFNLFGVISPGCSIRFNPKNYKNNVENIDEGLAGSKYPVCAWANDVYTNWLTQNALNLSIGMLSDVVNIAGGAVGISMSEGEFGTQSIVSGIKGIIGNMTSIYEHSLTPSTAEGNTNTGDANQSLGYNDFFIEHKTLREEYLKIIDGYFSRFGYKVNEIKTPNLNSRTQFNYIKVGGMDELISGVIPAKDLDLINSILRKGTTIFHNYNNFGNYTVNNPIVS